VFQALDAPPLLLRARIARCVDGLDMNLYEQCLEVRRQFESEFCPQDEADLADAFETASNASDRRTVSQEGREHAALRLDSQKPHQGPKRQKSWDNLQDMEKPCCQDVQSGCQTPCSE
ncbi:unnamed protein product, partial [Polarella glacialis]